MEEDVRGQNRVSHRDFLEHCILLPLVFFACSLIMLSLMRLLNHKLVFNKMILFALQTVIFSEQI